MWKKFLKIIAIICASIGVLFMGLVIFIMIMDSRPSSSDNQTDNQTKVSYIDCDMYKELRTYTNEQTTTPIALGYSIDISDEQIFTYQDYYQLDEALNLYHRNQISKENGDAILSNGMIDSEKLIKQVLDNNEQYMNQGSNAINVFYTEMDSTDLRMICEKITKVINDLGKAEVVGDCLKTLTMFEKSGSASNAYVTHDLTFVYNPTMTGLYADMQEIQGRDENTTDAVIVHEIMHLLQYGMGDTKLDNGVEAGMCRMYNVPNLDKQLVVDSLWYPWVLEASAELGMADYLDVEPGTYTKKISYLTSYNLSRFNDLEKGLEKIAYLDSLEDVFLELHLTTKQEQLDFLTFLYSVEITQSDPEDFWNSYPHELSEDERLKIRKEIRTQAVEYLTCQFFSQLQDAIQQGNITDLETVFYLLLNWELDVYHHLEYTQSDSYEVALPALNKQSQLQQRLFNSIASGSSLTYDQIVQRYEHYHLQAQIGEEIKNNCNLSNYSDEIESYILNTKNKYTSSSFSRVQDVVGK